MNSLVGTATMMRLQLRRDRVRLPTWLVGILATVYGSARSVQGVYPTQADLDLYARSVGDSPAAIAMSGPPVAMHTLGGVTVFEISSTAIIATALMAVLLTVRHTRTEEETGRTELLRATVLGRYAPIAATLLVMTAASLVVGAGIAASLISVGLDTAGSLVFGASIAMVGIVFTAVAALAAQITEHARAASGIAGALLATSYVLRAAGDVGNGVLTWLSPIGWSQAVHAFGGNRWWPLAFSVALTLVLVCLSLTLVERRDVGAGLVRPRPGRATAAPRLAGSVALMGRLQRGLVIGWTVGVFLGGLAYGSVSKEVKDLIDSRPDLRDYFAAGGADIVDAFFANTAVILALVSAGFTVSSALRLRSEETAGRVEPLLATGLSRQRLLLGAVAVTVVGTFVVVGAGGLGLGVAHAVVSGDATQIPRLAAVTLAYLPATLLLGGLAYLLYAWAPPAVLASWGALAVCLVIGWLGVALNLPNWVLQVSPFTHIPRVPAAPMTWAPVVALSVLTVVLGAGAVAGFRRRDVG